MLQRFFSVGLDIPLYLLGTVSLIILLSQSKVIFQKALPPKTICHINLLLLQRMWRQWLNVWTAVRWSDDASWEKIFFLLHNGLYIMYFSMHWNTSPWECWHDRKNIPCLLTCTCSQRLNRFDFCTDIEACNIRKQRIFKWFYEGIIVSNWLLSQVTLLLISFNLN